MMTIKRDKDIERINTLIKQLKEFHQTKEYKAWKENPTEENIKKAKEIRKQIIK